MNPLSLGLGSSRGFPFTSNHSSPTGELGMSLSSSGTTEFDGADDPLGSVGEDDHVGRMEKSTPSSCYHEGPLSCQLGESHPHRERAPPHGFPCSPSMTSAHHPLHHQSLRRWSVSWHSVGEAYQLPGAFQLPGNFPVSGRCVRVHQILLINTSSANPLMNRIASLL